MARGGAAKSLADKKQRPLQGARAPHKGMKGPGGSERVDIISRDRLKPHLGSVAPKAAVPPKRGRPRTASVASASVAAKPGGPV